MHRNHPLNIKIRPIILTTWMSCQILSCQESPSETMTPSVVGAATATPLPQASAAIPSGAVTTILPGNCTLPLNTPIELELLDNLSSKTNKIDDYFSMIVKMDIKIGDIIVIPKDSKAIGQVVHAAKARMGGKAGELILAARYVELPQGRIKLKSGLGLAGKNNTGGSVAVALAVSPILGLVVRGGELELPAGSHLLARTAAAFPTTTSP